MYGLQVSKLSFPSSYISHWSHFTRSATCLGSLCSESILESSSLCLQEEILTPKSYRGHEGQLGLNKINTDFEQSWKRSCGWSDLQVLSVEAGGWNSFVIVKSK